MTSAPPSADPIDRSEWFGKALDGFALTRRGPFAEEEFRSDVLARQAIDPPGHHSGVRRWLGTVENAKFSEPWRVA